MQGGDGVREEEAVAILHPPALELLQEDEDLLVDVLRRVAHVPAVVLARAAAAIVDPACGKSGAQSLRRDGDAGEVRVAKGGLDEGVVVEALRLLFVLRGLRVVGGDLGLQTARADSVD